MQDQTLDSNILTTRSHFEILNGLRGLAAIAVVGSFLYL